MQMWPKQRGSTSLEELFTTHMLGLKFQTQIDNHTEKNDRQIQTNEDEVMVKT